MQITSRVLDLHLWNVIAEFWADTHGARLHSLRIAEACHAIIWC